MKGSCAHFVVSISVVFTQQSILVYNFLDFIVFLVTLMSFLPCSFLCILEGTAKVITQADPSPYQVTSKVLPSVYNLSRQAYKAYNTYKAYKVRCE